MSNKTTTRKTNRRPARERKNPSGVQNQLSKRRLSSVSRKQTKNPDMSTTLGQPITEAKIRRQRRGPQEVASRNEGRQYRCYGFHLFAPGL
jgi:hypothetical protein